VIADNVLWKGLVAKDAPPASERARVDALRDFNLRLVAHPQLRGVVLPLGDGVGFAVRI
jgi:predicted O-methyltransferase YrrM